MFLARVTGSLVSSQKVDSMVGQKLLVVEPLRIQEQSVDGRSESQLVSTGRTFISVDTVGAGEGQVVLIVQGSSARFTPSTKPLPIDCAIIGLVDVVQIQGKIVFNTKSAEGGSGDQADSSKTEAGGSAS